MSEVWHHYFGTVPHPQLRVSLRHFSGRRQLGFRGEAVLRSDHHFPSGKSSSETCNGPHPRLGEDGLQMIKDKMPDTLKQCTHCTNSTVKEVSLSSSAQSCLTLCSTMGCNMPGFPVHHQLLELAQTPVHWVGDAIQPSHPVIPFSSHPQFFSASGYFPTSQFFASGGQSTGPSISVSVLPVNTQDWSPLGWTGLISLLSKGLSRVFSNTTVQKHQFFGIQLSLWSNSHIYTQLLEKP